VGVFWGCSKEETLNSVTTSTNDAIPAIRKISVDDVKKWYKEPVASGSLGSRSDGIKTALGAVPLFPIAFQTTGTHIDSFYNGKVEYVITPVRASSLIPTSRFQGNFLLFNRTAQGNIESKLIVFYADEDAYKDSTKVINFQNFTGQMIFLDENNKVQKYQKMVNGVVVQKNYSALSLKVIADGLTGDNTGVGLSTRCDDSDPGSCYNGWGTSGWSKFWGAVGRALSWVAGSGTGGGDARSFGSSVNDGFDSDLSYVQANRSPHASDNGGGGPETNPKQIWCTNLLSGWQDDKLQAVLDGEIPASHYNGYITTTSRAELEFRNKLREFQAVMQCEHVHKMNEMPEFTNTAYDYYVAKGRSAVAREKIAEVLFYLAEHPEHTNVVNENAPNYFNKYNVANFSISEFVKLASDPVLFAQVDGFLNQNGFNNQDAIKISKLHAEIYSNDLEYASLSNAEGKIPVPVILWILKSGASTIVDAAIDVAFGYLTGCPPGVAEHLLSFGTNLIGTGEASRVLKISKYTAKIVELANNIRKIPGGTALADNIIKLGDDLLAVVQSIDLSNITSAQNKLSGAINKFIGSVYEARIAVSLGSTLKGVSLRGADLASHLGLSPTDLDVIAAKLGKSTNDLEVDVLELIGDKISIGECKSLEIEKNFANYASRAQLLGQAQLAKEISAKTGKDVFITMYVRDIKSEVKDSYINRLAQEGVWLNIVVRQ
jgi:hypothetical protein